MPNKDKENEDTEQDASMADQLDTVRSVAQLLRTPDGRKRAKEMLIARWEKMEEAEKRRTN